MRALSVLACLRVAAAASPLLTRAAQAAPARLFEAVQLRVPHASNGTQPQSVRFILANFGDPGYGSTLQCAAIWSGPLPRRRADAAAAWSAPSRSLAPAARTRSEGRGAAKSSLRQAPAAGK